MIGLKQTTAGISPKSSIFRDAVSGGSSGGGNAFGAPALNTSQILHDNQTKFSRFDRGQNKPVEEQQEAPKKPLPSLDSNNDGRIDKFEINSALSNPNVRGTELEKIAIRLLKQQQHMNKKMDGNLGVNLNAPPPQGIFGFHGIA